MEYKCLSQEEVTMKYVKSAFTPSENIRTLLVVSKSGTYSKWNEKCNGRIMADE